MKNTAWIKVHNWNIGETMSKSAASPKRSIRFPLSFSIIIKDYIKTSYLLICSRTQMQLAMAAFSASARFQRRTPSVRKTASVYPLCRTIYFPATSSESTRASVCPRMIFVLYGSVPLPEIYPWSDRAPTAVCSPGTLSLNHTQHRDNSRAAGAGLDK